MSETSQFQTTPCGRWDISYDVEHFLGDTTEWFKIYDRKTFKELVVLYDFPYNGIYFSPDYDYLFLERDASDHDIIEIKTGKSLVLSSGAWYKEGHANEKGSGMIWPRNNAGLVPLSVLLKDVPEVTRTF
nr:hypothetical protein [Candidatus Sigynarchaeota archaeon]